MMRGRGVASALLAVVVAGLLLSSAEEDGRLPRRRSLHQPFFPIDYSPPPPGSDGSPVPPPPAAPAASEAAKGGGGRSGSSLTNVIAIALAAGLVALAVAGYSCFLLLRRRSDGVVDGGRVSKSARAVDARVASDVGSVSDRRHRSPPPSSTASDAIYIDPLTTMVERPGSPDLRPLALVKQPSPDLRPLPPLKRQAQQPPPPPASTPPMTGTGDSSDEEDQETFYTARKTAASSFSRSTSQRSTLEQAVHQPSAPAPAPTFIPAPPPPPLANSLKPPRPPPPPPPLRQRLLRPMPAESPPPPALANLVLTNSSEPSAQDRGGENPDGHDRNARQQKPPSLKPLHWDKLRAISGRTTVWDQVNNSDSFRVDEAAMESLFTNKVGGTGNSDQAARRGGTAGKQEGPLLDPKRLQNVAIMLKALNVTSAEVIGALVHGNGDLGPEFFEALAKMAPTKEEELKLKYYSGDLLKLDPAERFLKDIIGVPFAFKRVDAMLYRANFDTELNYLRKSFGTLEAACADLRSSKLFLKLLDAVLKTGNRMNDGTNRGEASAFRLDTLLKLADIKSTDGKTTVLHFVVQELIRSEGLGSNQTEGIPAATSKEQFKKDGLKVLAGLSGELSNVKSAATLEMDTLISNVSRLETDLLRVKQVLELKETCPDQGSSDNLFDEMDAFLSRAQSEIESVKVTAESALRHVKDTTEYFHGDATKEEPHHLRIFIVVSDFLATLDRVCRDVGRTPERVMMGSGKSFRVTAGTSLPPRRYEHRRELSSSDEDSSSS